jgi:hypothetical protein
MGRKNMKFLTYNSFYFFRITSLFHVFLLKLSSWKLESKQTRGKHRVNKKSTTEVRKIENRRRVDDRIVSHCWKLFSIQTFNQSGISNCLTSYSAQHILLIVRRNAHCTYLKIDLVCSLFCNAVGALIVETASIARGLSSD